MNDLKTKLKKLKPYTEELEDLMFFLVSEKWINTLIKHYNMSEEELKKFKRIKEIAGFD